MRSPTDSRDRSDPGDQVIRKFRYQHAYGVVLAILMVNRMRPYRAIWCEQHEDLLAERTDNRFEAFQVKTRKPETGAWNISDEAFVKSIKRFTELDSEFPDQLAKFYFVSNTEYSDSNAKKNIHLSPVKLLKAIQAAKSLSNLAGPPLDGFKTLLSLTGCREDSLFLVLNRLELVHGPTERAFEDELCQTHLPTLPQCDNLSAGSLAKVLTGLIARMEIAASLQSTDPLRHCVGITSSDEDDPFLLGKRVLNEDVILVIRDACDMGVQYPKELATLTLDEPRSTRQILKKKMYRGGLAVNYEAMRRKALTAESALLDVATRSADGKQKIAQVENVVLSECDEASLRARTRQSLFGPAMLIDLQDRLKRIATEEPLKVNRQPYEVLVGVSGLLSDACKVWWSEVFELEEA